MIDEAGGDNNTHYLKDEDTSKTVRDEDSYSVRRARKESTNVNLLPQKIIKLHFT